MLKWLLLGKSVKKKKIKKSSAENLLDLWQGWQELSFKQFFTINSTNSINIFIGCYRNIFAIFWDFFGIKNGFATGSIYLIFVNFSIVSIIAMHITSDWVMPKPWYEQVSCSALTIHAYIFVGQRYCASMAYLKQVIA